MNRNGHIILFKPAVDLAKYMDLDFYKKNIVHFEQLRNIFNFIEPNNYRGTGRMFFSSAPYFYDSDKGVMKYWNEADLSTYDNLEARQLFAKLEEENTAKDTLDDLCFFSLSDMQSVFDLIENKDHYELIEYLECESEIKPTTLGFDVGYLAADYSVIADTAIKPMWHPPDFDDIQDIVEHLKKLNEHCLFSTLRHAKDFRKLYLTKDWGEKEMYDGQITTIQVRKTV